MRGPATVELSSTLATGGLLSAVKREVPRYLRGLRHARRTLVILSLALSGCRAQIAPPNPTPELRSLTLITDRATEPLLRELVSTYRRASVLLSWDIQAGDASAVYDWLESGQAPYALTSYLPDDPAANRLWSTPVGQDAIAFVVNAQNSIDSLNAAQLRGVLQGRIDNWQALGRDALPITVVARSASSAAAQLVQDFVLGDRKITRNALLATTDAAVVRLVAGTPGAIGYVPMSYLVNAAGVRPVALDNVLPTPATVGSNQYPLRSPLVILGNQPPGDDDYRAFFAWIQSPEGQAIVRKFVGGLDG